MVVASKSLAEQRVIPAGTRADRAWEKHQITWCPITDQVWLLNSNAASVSLLDGTTADLVATLELPSSPQQAVFNAQTGLAYVCLLADAVAVLDVRTGQLLTTLPLPEGSQPWSLLPIFDRHRLYVSSPHTGAGGQRGVIHVIDTDSNTVIDGIPAGCGPLWGQPRGARIGKLFFTNRESNDITIVDERTERVIAQAPVGRCPERSAVFDREIFFGNMADNTVSAVDIETNTVTATIPVGVTPFRMHVSTADSANGRVELWVLNAGCWQLPCVPPQASGGQISVISEKEHRVIQTIQVVEYPANWTFYGYDVYVASSTAREMTIVDARGGAVIGAVRLSRDPARGRFGGMVHSKSGKLFVANADNTVSVFGPL
jgi:YVTN family beta-propeller protein